MTFAQPLSSLAFRRTFRERLLDQDGNPIDDGTNVVDPYGSQYTPSGAPTTVLNPNSAPALVDRPDLRTIGYTSTSTPSSALAASGTATAPNSAAYTGFSPNTAFEGFDFQREQNPGKSAKDAFAMLANQAPEQPPETDKAALATWFQRYIQPGMEALGHHVLSVTGDAFTFQNWQGTFTVDYRRGAGAPGGALAWQVQGQTGQPTTAATTGTASTTPGQASSTADLPVNPYGGVNPSLPAPYGVPVTSAINAEPYRRLAPRETPALALSDLVKVRTRRA